MKKTPANERAGQGQPVSGNPGATASGTLKASTDRRDATDAGPAAGDPPNKPLEVEQLDQEDALQSIRRSQDLAAEAQRLQRALETSRMRIVELEGRCRDMQQEVAALTADRDERARREESSLASLAEARAHFQARIEQFTQSLAALQRLHRPDTPDNGAA